MNVDGRVVTLWLSVAPSIDEQEEEGVCRCHRIFGTHLVPTTHPRKLSRAIPPKRVISPMLRFIGIDV